MGHIKGINFIVKVNTGTEAAPVWTKIGGQRGAKLNQSSDSIDTTSKDGNGWKDIEAALKEWSIEADGLIVADDTGFEALEDAFLNSEKVLIQLGTASGTVYKGKALITDLPIDAPYDNMATYSVTFTGSGDLVKE